MFLVTMHQGRLFPDPSPEATDGRGRLPCRPKRWREAVAELLTLQPEYADWLEALPEGLHESPTAQALEAIVELDLDSLADIDPPRGYGRD